MKILLVGQYKVRGDGWSEATRSLIKSIQTLPNVELTIRNVNMANRGPSTETEFASLEQAKGPFDVVLQKVLPSLFTYDASFKQNIGLCVFESILPKNHQYIYRISNLLNKVTVTNNLESQWLREITNTPVFPIGEAIDIDKYKQVYQPIHPIFQDKSIFKFLFSGEDTERKNLQALVRAYFTEFKQNENVTLVIKTNTDVGPKIEKIKQSLRKSIHGKYPIVAVINQHIAENDMASLYQHSDCLVVPSKGESFCRGAAEMIAAGKPVITTDNIGTADFMHANAGWIVKSETQPCYCEQPPVADIYTCEEKWQEIDILHLQDCLRQAYSDKELYQYKCEKIKELKIAEQFSYKTIGRRLLGVIEA